MPELKANMIEIGKYNELKVKKEVDFGLYLEAGEDEILIPTRYVPAGTLVGDTLRVFIYRDSEDRVIATTLHPEAIAGECAFLEVKEVTKFGAFLEWGMPKDLLVPFREQDKPMQEGRVYLVYVYLDEQTQRITASSRLNRFIKNDSLDVSEGDAVDLIIGEATDLGYKAIINHKYWGVIYHNEIFKAIKTGDKVKGFIKKIREDNKIDLSLQKQGYEEVLDASERLVELLNEQGGFLPLNDKSAPEAIYARTQMSKKTFKKAVGALYKERKITIGDEGISLISM